MAAKSLDPLVRRAALTQARYQFLKDFNLRGATKKNVVKYLANTVVASEASIGRGLTESVIKAKREENVKRIEGLGYSVARQGGSNIQANYNEVSEQLFVQNTGLTRGQAAEKAFQTLKNGFVDTGNTDALEDLLDVQKIPGQEGTEFGRTHEREIREAIASAQTKNKEIRTAKVTVIKAQMERQLASASSLAEQEVIVTNAAEQMKAVGAFKDARTTLQDFKTLSKPGGVEINNARVLQSVLDGEITSEKQLQKLLRERKITQTGYNSAKSALGEVNAVKPPKDPLISKQLDGYADRFDSDFLQAVGLRKNIDGSLAIDPAFGDTQVVTKGQAEIIMEQARTDLTRLTNQIVSDNRDLSGQKLSEVVYKAQNEWFRNNVVTEGGKYYLGDLVAPGSVKEKQERRGRAQRRFNSLLSNPTALSRLTGSTTAIQPRSFQNEIGQGQAVPTSVQVDYNPRRRDTVFDSADVQKYAESFDKGVIDPSLASVAQQLGLTPLALLNQQLRAYDLPVKEPRLTNPEFKPQSIPVSEQVSSNVTATDMVAGAQQLMGLDFPAKGAAYLAGNIQQESGWYGQRNPWDDVGAPAGGLVSWRAERLNSLESYFGKPVSEISNADQIAYMIVEMQQPQYLEAYRIFKNPHATKRQLERASFIYWGYGDVGARYSYAQQTLAQIQ